jgi:hypothetical protein
MISGLISGPQQSGNDIDTYFRPLVEDLKVLSYIAILLLFCYIMIYMNAYYIAQ